MSLDTALDENPASLFGLESDEDEQENLDKELTDRVNSFYNDPYGFVLFAFPWLQPGTSLENESGPDEWQTEVLCYLARELQKDPTNPFPKIRLAVRSGHGVGKAHPVEMRLDTPDGVRRWGDLRPGDRVFGRDGKPTKITAIHPQGKKPVHRVTFDDESSAMVCAEHLWQVHSRRRGWETLSTEEIERRGVKRKNGPGRARAFKIPRHEAVEYPYQWVPVDPYTLGAWLGDGCRNTSRVVNMDEEVFDRIRAAGYELTENDSRSSGKARVFNVSHLQPALRRLGVGDCYSHEKHVPDCYKYNLPEVRAEVLRGLIDTDGFVTPTGTVQFTSSSAQLVDDVVWLTRSLGGKARLYKPQRNARTCSLTFPDGFQPCYIQRKRDRIRHETQKRYLDRYIDRIELEGEADCMCITVEAEDSLYLCNDFIVTHNTALVAWIIIWFIATRGDPQVVVTANTKMQLSTKTWRELAKWADKCIMSHWFEHTGTQFKLRSSPKTWFATAVPWSASNSEAFAGTHEKHVLYLFDEASAIDDIIWEVAEGAMTTHGAMWLAFGNPTQPQGRFRQCWTKFRKRWKTYTVDSRKAKKADQVQIQEWIEDYGVDSDFVRVRVRGLPPREGPKQFIGEALVRDAMDRIVDQRSIPLSTPRVAGIDVAREGDDKSVALCRWGRKVIPESIMKIDSMDLMTLASYIADWINQWKPDVVFLEMDGLGAGVYDRLIQLGYDNVVGVYSGSRKVLEPKTHYNKRIEMWDRMKRWLADADMPDDNDFLEDLTGPERLYDQEHRMRLEPKELMKKRGLASPDCGDALAVTFAEPVPQKVMTHSDDCEPELEEEAA